MLLALLVCVPGWTSCARAEALLFSTAQAHLMPEQAPQWSGPVELPHQWDKVFPGRGGRASYQLQLPPLPIAAPPHGLYFPRVGNQIEIRVGGALLLRRGALDDGRVDAAKSPLWVPVPTGLLSASSTTALEVLLTTQPGRWGGLAKPRFGLESELFPEYRVHYVWRQLGAVAVVFSIALMGIIAAGLWWLQRETIYGYFALAAPFGALRFSDRLLEQPPLGWPLWGAVMALSMAVHLLLLTRFSLAIIGRDDQRVRQAFWSLLAIEAGVSLTSFMAGQPWLWTLGLGLLFPPALWAYAVALHQACTTRRREALALCLASLIPIGAGLRDFLGVRLSNDGADRYSFLPFATMLFVLLMGWLILDRYARQTREYRGLLASLDHKVQQRERELQDSYSLLQHEHAQRAALVERQRIMRDIHDGVGSQLVGLLSLIGKGRTSRTQLREHANAALDELRMAVDAMQPVNGDLATVLATLRYRLQPRLVASGIEVDWQVEELPTMAHLTPQMVLQIQRILLEAFTNVLRHARASRVRVSARQQDQPPQHLLLEIADNGVGLPDPSPASGGQGLANMQARAQAIGAVLSVTSRPGEGTCVRIELPAQGEAA